MNPMFPTGYEQPAEHEGSDVAWISMSDLFALIATFAFGLAFALNISERELRHRVETFFAGVAKSGEDPLTIASRASEAEALKDKLEDALIKLAQAEALRADLERQVLLLVPPDAGETSSAQIRRLAEELTELNRKLAGARTAETAAKEEVRTLLEQNRLLAANIENLKKLMEQASTGQHEIRKELLGIDGSLDRVVFVIDRSDSMRFDIGGKKMAIDPAKWDKARQTMRLWLEGLPVKEAALVSFTYETGAFPADRRLLAMNPANRARLLSEFDALRPIGFSALDKGLEKAMEFGAAQPLDAIVLLSDGEADDFAKAIAVVASMKQNPRLARTRIHVIGVGDYFQRRPDGKKAAVDLLKEISGSTGGTFLAR